MKTMTLSLLLFAFVLPARAADPTRVLGADEKSQDKRLGPPRTLNDYHPMAEYRFWIDRRDALRNQVLVATGLWPMPPKTDLKAVIHGKIDRDEYTIEKVYFASMPGHYVTGNLYRPKSKDKPAAKSLPGVLCPHGHWKNGRFFDAGEQAAQKEMQSGAEQHMGGARHPLQARCAQLARMGCVVFHYDMVGNADSTVIGHTAGFTDAEAELRLQSFMGLQTWNSVRSLDFLLSLPEIDPKRIGVTGASGGGTQTFLLCGIDDRPTVAFPAVMVSTAMQGGCICENASYLRIGAGNIDLAALCAPRPLGMSGAKDWTIDIETKGLPDLKKLYKSLGVEDNVMAKCFPEFGHNYNQVSREVMYHWFNKHLKLGQTEPIKEKALEPVPPKELSVWDNDHKLPADAVGADRLRQHMTATSDEQIKALMPKDAQSLAEFERVFGTALKVMTCDPRPVNGVVTHSESKETKDDLQWRRLLIGRKGGNDRVPTVWLRGKDFDGTVVVWVHPQGKASLMKDGTLTAEAKQILDLKAGVVAMDVLGVGEQAFEKPRAVDKKFAGYTFGYNPPLLASRVHDILTVLEHVCAAREVQKVHLVGWEGAGPWVLLARYWNSDTKLRWTGADFNNFRFASIKETSDDNLLPGAVKYGDLPALAALNTRYQLLVFNVGKGGTWLKAAYGAADTRERLLLHEERLEASKVIDILVR